MVNETNSTGPANPKAVFFDICDTLGIVERKRHLVKYQPTTDARGRFPDDKRGSALLLRSQVRPQLSQS